MPPASGSDTAAGAGATKPKLVPRKKLQSVPELLRQGPEEETEAESLASKISWLLFLLVLFYFSFEIFLRAQRVEGPSGSGGQSEL